MSDPALAPGTEQRRLILLLTLLALVICIWLFTQRNPQVGLFPRTRGATITEAYTDLRWNNIPGLKMTEERRESLYLHVMGLLCGDLAQLTLAVFAYDRDLGNYPRTFKEFDPAGQRLVPTTREAIRAGFEEGRFDGALEFQYTYRSPIRVEVWVSQVEEIPDHRSFGYRNAVSFHCTRFVRGWHCVKDVETQDVEVPEIRCPSRSLQPVSRRLGTPN